MTSADGRRPVSPFPGSGKTADVTSPPAAALAERLESVEALDPVGSKIGKIVRDAIPGGPVKDALSGVFMGHALHPLLTDIPIGTFTSSLLLDLVGEDEASRKLIVAGLLATPPTLITGWSDWADSEMGDPGVRRVGLMHAALNGTAITLMAASLVARRKGRTGRGKLLSLAGMSLMGGGGWLGGHLSYSQGIGVDQTVFDSAIDDWAATDVAETDLADGKARCAMVDGTPVMLVRDGGEIRALHNRCAHRGGPLDTGEIANGTVTCPWHHTVFSLADGSVEQGPSTFPQPVYDTRVTGGKVEVRLRAH